MSRRLSNSARAPSWDRLKVVEMAIAELSPAPKHARKHPASQIRSLAQSIESFGFNAPALVDETNRLLSGHARVEAEKRAFTLADNRLAEQARWDDALLAENFQILDSLDLAFPLEATGFETTEIDRLLGFEIVDEFDAADAPIPLADGPAIAKPGDLWQLGPHRLYCGDALDQCSYAMLMGDDRARMILTDPPYNLAAQEIGRGAARRHGDFVSGAGELDDAGFVEFLAAMFGHARRTAVDGALAYVFMDWRHAWHALTAGRRAFDALKNVCIWDKGSRSCSRGCGSSTGATIRMTF